MPARLTSQALLLTLADQFSSGPSPLHRFLVVIGVVHDMANGHRVYGPQRRSLIAVSQLPTVIEWDVGLLVGTSE